MYFRAKTHPYWRDQPMVNMTALSAILCFSYFISLNSLIKVDLVSLNTFTNLSIIKATIGYL